MNFTDNYIEMCINNVNIQNLCRHNKGDWFWNGEKPYLYCKSGLGSSNPHDYKWLPTLEDLFGIADWGHYSINKNIGDHGYYYGKENLFGEIKYPGETFSSLKEMVLAVVMEINYNKSWNKKEWEEM